jgi:hypothetical protein
VAAIVRELRGQLDGVGTLRTGPTAAAADIDAEELLQVRFGQKRNIDRPIPLDRAEHPIDVQERKYPRPELELV